MPLLLTAFQPFGRLLRNPSRDVALRLSRDPRFRAAGGRIALLPVDREAAPRRLEALVARHAPAVLLMTGVAPGRAAPSLELLARNTWRGPRRGALTRRIDPVGPDRLRATLPVRTVLRALSRVGIPGACSRDAGTYACNLVLYTALRWRQTTRRQPGGATRLVGFLHLPATPECLPPRARPIPTVDLACLTAGVREVALALVSRGGKRGSRPIRT